jgi:hypothetical protein
MVNLIFELKRRNAERLEKLILSVIKEISKL